MVDLKFPSKVSLILEKERSSLYSGNPWGCRQEEQITRTVILWPGAFETELHNLDGDPCAFLPISAVVSKENSEWRGWNSEGINCNNKWRKIGVSDLPSIRPTENNFLQPLAWLCIPPCYNLHVHGEESFWLLLCLPFRSLGLPLLFVKKKNTKMSIKKIQITGF